MTLCDASAVIALINRKDKNHGRAIAALPSINDGLIITPPCIAEAMYLLGSLSGWVSQSELWGYLEDGLIDVHESSLSERHRMFELMSNYKDTPMDYGDASLVAAAESLDALRIFTFDHHFRVYRASGTRAFEVIPA